MKQKCTQCGREWPDWFSPVCPHCYPDLHDALKQIETIWESIGSTPKGDLIICVVDKSDQIVWRQFHGRSKNRP